MLTQLSVFLENKEGKLDKVLRFLTEAGIDIRALTLADSTDFGMVRMIADDPHRAKEALEAAHCIATVTDVVGVVVPDTVGGLSGLLSLLTANGIAIEYMYSCLTDARGDARMVLRVADALAVENLLKEKGYTVL